eukprot:2837410-Rhodomonas_salina.3
MFTCIETRFTLIHIRTTRTVAFEPHIAHTDVGSWLIGTACVGMARVVAALTLIHIRAERSIPRVSRFADTRETSLCIRAHGIHRAARCIKSHSALVYVAARHSVASIACGARTRKAPSSVQANCHCIAVIQHSTLRSITARCAISFESDFAGAGMPSRIVLA